MSVSREINTVKNYTIVGGGFGGGLFNSINGSLIPDNCLADISNLHIDHFGNLHSVAKPTELATAYRAGTPISSLMLTTHGVYCNQGGTLYKDGVTGTVWTVDPWMNATAESPVGSNVAWVTQTEGLWVAGTNYSWAHSDFVTGQGIPSSRSIAEFEGRIWLDIGPILRGSDLYAPELEEAWRGPVDPVDLTTMTLGNCILFTRVSSTIRQLKKCRGMLFIFHDAGITTMTTFFGGTLRLAYNGPDVPRFGASSPFRIYSDGNACYYASDNKFIAFDGATPTFISDRLSLPSAATFFAGEYDGRFWFLPCVDATPTGEEANYLYSVDKTTGAWEKYDIQMTAKNGAVYDTPTCMAAGEDPISSLTGNRLYMGTSLGKIWYLNPTSTNDPLAWSFTTKTYTPSFDAYSRFQHFKIRYVGQAASSPVTIKQYVCRDGTATLQLTDTTSLNMQGAGMYQRDIECHAELGEGVYFVINGTGTASIADCGVEFTTKGAGDVNRIGGSGA